LKNKSYYYGGNYDMGAQARFDSWRNEQKRLVDMGAMPPAAKPQTMLLAMQSIKKQRDSAYEATAIADCDRRLQIILALYEGAQ
jgi:hypothetical protein